MLYTCTMGEDLAELIWALDQCRDKIYSIKSDYVRRDLNKLFANALNMVHDSSRELVECRRMKLITTRYRNHILSLTEAVTNLEHHLTLGYLMEDNSNFGM